MADVDLSTIFTHVQSGSTDGDTAPLSALLGSVSGVTINPDDDLNKQLKQGAVTVISVFQPNPCTLESTSPGTAPGPSGTPGSAPAPAPAPAPGQDGVGLEGGHGGEVLLPSGIRIAAPLREKLLTLGSTFNELVALLDQPGVPVALAAPASRADEATPKCWHYRSTSHGPTGLFRSRELLKVQVSGFIETLGGLTKVNAGAEYIMYMEYSVNTYLAGSAAWKLAADTQQPEPLPPVTLTATNGCYGMGGKVKGLKSCGSDTVADVLRVIVNFKKVFVCDASASGSNLTGSGGLQAYVSKMQEQSFAGVFQFTHSMDPRPPKP